MARRAWFLILHFIRLFLLQSCMFNFASAAILNVTTDQSALLALKDHISSDPYHVLISNWSTSTSVCNWVGVTCGSKHLRVKTLNLSYMGLVGTIPPHIGNLSFLVRISFVNNSFHGSIPNELSRLHRLEYLNFGYNEFSGKIPYWLGFLTKLQFLSLYGNNFEGTIPSSLSNITSLQRFYLSYNKLSGSIPSSIFNIFGLQKILLAENKLTGPMPSILVNMSSLQIIDLSYNMLVGTLPMYIFDHLPNLQYVSLSSNQLHGQLPSTLYKCKQLQVLSLSRNHFNGRISPEIGNLTMLTELHLEENNLEGSIPNEIGNLQNLELISIGINGFVGPIPFKIFNISTIQTIYMGLSKFSGHLPSDMGLYLPKLKQLSLYRNKLSGIIPSSISNASQLTLLDLNGNSLSGIIPEALEYGLGGVVSTKGDVYSYGILLIETFTRKRPTDDMFAGEMTLKCWVNEALPISTIDIVDASLLGNERYHVALEECISSIMGLALDCCAELPDQRTNMKIVLATLKKIKTKSLRDVEGH